MKGVKNFCISKYEYSAFFCTKNHCHILKSRENSHQWSATILKQEKFWKFQIFKNQFFKNIFSIASKWWHFIDGYFHEFLRYDNDSWCKRKLNIHTLRCKSFLPPSLVFYPLFLRRKSLKIDFEHSKHIIFKPKKGCIKLVEGGKKLLLFLKYLKGGTFSRVWSENIFRSTRVKSF